MISKNGIRFISRLFAVAGSQKKHSMGAIEDLQRVPLEAGLKPRICARNFDEDTKGDCEIEKSADVRRGLMKVRIETKIKAYKGIVFFSLMSEQGRSGVTLKGAVLEPFHHTPCDICEKFHVIRGEINARFDWNQMG